MSYLYIPSPEATARKAAQERAEIEAAELRRIEPYESREALEADKQLYVEMGYTESITLYDLHAFIAERRKAYRKAQELGAVAMEFDVADSIPAPWHPYESIDAYYFDRCLLVACGFSAEATANWTPAYLFDRMKPYRLAYQKARHGAEQPAPVIDSEPEQQFTSPALDVDAMEALDIEPPANPPAEIFTQPDQSGILSRLTGIFNIGR